MADTETETSTDCGQPCEKCEHEHCIHVRCWPCGCGDREWLNPGTCLDASPSPFQLGPIDQPLYPDWWLDHPLSIEGALKFKGRKQQRAVEVALRYAQGHLMTGEGSGRAAAEDCVVCEGEHKRCPNGNHENRTDWRLCPNA